MDKLPFLRLEDDLEREQEELKYGQATYSRNYLLSYFKKAKRPLKIQELLRINPLKDLAEALKNRIQAMVREGQLLRTKKGLIVNEEPLIEGWVSVNQHGYGFLVSENHTDIFLGPSQMRKVMEKDQVLVRVYRDAKGRKEGKIIKVLRRSRVSLFGKVGRKFKKLVLYPNEHNLKPIPLFNTSIADDSCVLASLEECNGELWAKVIKVLEGGISREVMESWVINNFGLSTTWSIDALKEVENLKEEKIWEDRVDWQSSPFVTIDGSDAKDFDDAVFGEKILNGYQLWVAIADVSHYVAENGVLDQEARVRSTSVYFPQQVIPMLPEILSNELCSLKPNLARPVIGCVMRLNEEGILQSYSFTKAVIKSKARLTYDQVYAFLENKQGIYARDVAQNLEHLRLIYLKLKKIREARFALDFHREEVSLEFIGDAVSAVIPKNNHYVHGMVEESMLLTNFCASQYLKGLPAMYRVHTPPKLDKLESLKDFLSKLGLKFGKTVGANVRDYALLLRTLKGRKDENLLQLKLLRSLNQAIYSWENLGHFALAYPTYLHFTSPIRRYPDLYNQRLLKSKLAGKVVKNIYPKNLAERCSDAERRADEASNIMLRWYQCNYLANHCGEIYDGVIVGLNESKLWVELEEVLIDGWVSLSSLGRYRLLPDRASLQRLSKKKTLYTLGDRVCVKVTEVDVFKREVVLQLV